MVLGVWRRVASVRIQLTVNKLLDTASMAARKGTEEAVAVKVTYMKAVCLSRIWYTKDTSTLLGTTVSRVFLLMAARRGTEKAVVVKVTYVKAVCLSLGFSYFFSLLTFSLVASSAGKYGKDCVQECSQYLAGEIFDRVTGQCPGLCEQGLYGVLCVTGWQGTQMA